jgi:hypothetical protein
MITLLCKGEDYVKKILCVFDNIESMDIEY